MLVALDKSIYTRKSMIFQNTFIHWLLENKPVASTIHKQSHLLSQN